MSALFDGKVVIVTGAGGGIGRQEALAFAAFGARVVVNDLGGDRIGGGKDSSPAAKVAKEIVDAGGEAIANGDSVSAPGGAESIVWAAQRKYGRVDVLVNNAGILRDRSLLNMSDGEWNSVIDVHLNGCFLMTRAFGRAYKMQKSTGGAIVNTTSVSGLRGNFGQGNYGAAKAGIFGLTRVSSMEFEKFGCRVNAIAPVALTRMTDDLQRLKERGIEAMGPQHVAPVVTWLASSLSDEVNGRVFGVEGAHVFEYAMDISAGLQTPPNAESWTPESLQENLKSFALEKNALNR
ncbi:MAG: SDR family NAD(P)-dependent oxidoreductase [Deltaproteobacteria bacterium]|nr:SDR family NAD(P)-dependent oxidoreductase [Deltaproteobacteria bacterium]